jgi:hypothetical protein
MSCSRARSFLDSRAAGLDESQQLFLEEHLADCAECREEARALSLARDILADGFELDQKSRSRVFSRAFAEAGAPSVSRASGRSRVWSLAAAAALFALVAGASTALYPRTHVRLRSAPAPELGANVWRPHVLSGRVTIGGRALEKGEVVADGARIVATERAVVQLGTARVALDPGSRISWNEKDSSVRLDAGRVELEVVHRNVRAFSVLTDEMRVDVVGTKFAVTRHDVLVGVGRVRVTRLADSSLHELGPGERFDLGTSASGGVLPNDDAGPGPGKAAVNVSAILASARRELSAGRVDRARAEVQRALGGNPTPAQTAEANSLLAECSLVAGDSKSAQAGYAKVARENAGTPAGETAAYAAARLEKDPKRARGLLEDYLRRYPNGRFRSEVQSRLSALPR